VPEVSAVTPAGKMTATVAATVATPGKVTTTVTTTTVTTATVATTAVATTCLGRHVGCGHYQASGSGSREAIDSGQGPKGQ
jgi:hypothetical protein